MQVKIDLTSYRIANENAKLFEHLEKLDELLNSFPVERQEEWRLAVLNYLGKKFQYKVLTMKES